MKAQNTCCVRESTDNNATKLQDIYIYYSPHGFGEATPLSVDRRQMFFCYEDIQDNFAKYLENWLAKAEKLRTVFDLYFGMFYIPSMYVHLEFLTLAQALEAYHQRLYGGMFMSPDEYEVTRESLAAAIPPHLSEDHRNSLKSRIKYGYSYSLRKRLKHILTDVLAPYGGCVDYLIGNQSNFIGKLVDTRNYLTHYTEELEKHAIVDPQKQYEFVQVMRLLMELCFLLELEIPADTVEKLMKRNNRYNRFRLWGD